MAAAVVAVVLLLAVVADLWARSRTFDELTSAAQWTAIHLELAEEAVSETLAAETERGTPAQYAYRRATRAGEHHRSEALATLQGIEDQWVLPWHRSLTRAQERFVAYARTREDRLGAVPAGPDEVAELGVETDAKRSVAEKAFRDAAPTIAVTFRRVVPPVPRFRRVDPGSEMEAVFNPQGSALWHLLQGMMELDEETLRALDEAFQEKHDG